MPIVLYNKFVTKECINNTFSQEVAGNVTIPYDRQFFISIFATSDIILVNLQCSKMFKGSECAVLPKVLCTIKYFYFHNLGLPGVAFLPPSAARTQSHIHSFTHSLLKCVLYYK